MGKLFIIVFISMMVSLNVVSYCMGEPSIRQRQLRERGNLLATMQLLETQINFNNKLIISMERDFSPMHIDGFQSKIAFKQLENMKLQAQLTSLKLDMCLSIVKNK